MHPYSSYSAHLSLLEADDSTIAGRPLDPNLQVTQAMYERTASAVDGTTVPLRQDGTVWTTTE